MDHGLSTIAHGGFVQVDCYYHEFGRMAMDHGLSTMGFPTATIILQMKSYHNRSVSRT
ncbi:MAG TPA: hypothetical protein VFE53_12070 [Mucilaginibacter sp.]|nr:hypothetical protein [Mucilaginibacter sp.]